MWHTEEQMLQLLLVGLQQQLSSTKEWSSFHDMQAQESTVEMQPVLRKKAK